MESNESNGNAWSRPRVQQQGVLPRSWQGSDWWKLRFGKTGRGLNQYPLGVQPGLEEEGVDWLVSFQPALSNYLLHEISLWRRFSMQEQRDRGGTCVWTGMSEVGKEGRQWGTRWGKRYAGNGKGVSVKGGKGTSSRPTLSALWEHSDS